MCSELMQEICNALKKVKLDNDYDFPNEIPVKESIKDIFGVDSLEQVGILTELQEHLKISLDDNEQEKIISVYDFYYFVAKHKDIVVDENLKNIILRI